MTARIVGAAVTLFFIATVSAPVAVLNKLLFALLLLVAVLRIVSAPADTRLPTWSPFVVIAVFMYGLIIALGGNADLPLARQLVFSVSLLLLIYPILWYDVDLDRVVKITGVVLASLTFVLVAAFLTAPVSPFSAQLLDLFMRYSLSGAGNRDFLGSPVLMVRLGSSHFLLLPFALLLADLRDRFRVWTVLALLLVFAAILASTSRGVFLLSVAAAVLILGERMSNIKRAAWGLVVAPLVLAAGAVLAMRTTVFSTAEEGNSIKLGHAASFLDNLSLPHVLFGEGLAAFYYSVGLGRQVPQTEITLFDMLRYFGFVLTPIMFAALFFPAWRLHHYIGDRRRVMAVALFVLYLALSLTNPVLFNSMGLSVVVWYWWRVLRPDDVTSAVTHAAMPTATTAVRQA